jgi:hypothetical protein
MPYCFRHRKEAVLALASAVWLIASCTSRPPATQLAPEGARPASYLYVWAGDKDEKDSDFLAVVDVRPDSRTYGQVVATTPVGMGGTLPHHLEYTLPRAGQTLFGNGHMHEMLFRFDFSDPLRPKVAGTLPFPPTLRFPHDFARLPNDHVLVGFLRSEGPSPVAGDTLNPGAAGGIAEYTPDGKLVRWASAADSSTEKPIRPYAFALLPESDRFLVTSANMMEQHWADAVQIWRLSDLRRLHTLQVPPANLPGGRVHPRGHSQPFEPRVMRDGSILFNAYGCGFYRVTGVATDAPQIHNVFTLDTSRMRYPFPHSRPFSCGIPVVVGQYWIMAVGGMNMLLSLDISDPEHPREVMRLFADSIFRPHWLAKDAGSNRIVVGAENGGENRMLIALIDPGTGQLRWDESLRAPDGTPGISFVRDSWPHGRTGEAFGHAALFRP